MQKAQKGDLKSSLEQLSAFLKKPELGNQ